MASGRAIFARTNWPPGTEGLHRSAAGSVNVFIMGDDARCRRIKRSGRETEWREAEKPVRYRAPPFVSNRTFTGLVQNAMIDPDSQANDRLESS